jgi:beta-xylosidase
MNMRLAIFLIAWSLLPACFADEPEPLDIAALVQPLEDRGVYRVAGYSTWGPQVTRGQDGKYYMVHSRWPKTGTWFADSEIAIAVADTPEGPYTHHSVLLQGRGPGYWDAANAHNPKIKYFDGKYYLYYISGQENSELTHYRVTQKVGVAVSDSITGPYVRVEVPALSPSPPLYNLAVNPGVTRMADGRYLMIAKGEIRPVAGGEPKPQRIQGMAIADTPVGPFKILPEPAIKDIDTEDASLWYDAARQKYFAVFHAHTFIGLIESDDGINWRKAENYKIIEGNEIQRADGSILATKAPFQRPSIYVEHGEPRLLGIAVPAAQRTDWYVIIVSLLPSGADRS